ncbi:MAG: TetR/AcrR family transcriptional regulator [Legionellales bacterium]|nr:TetR/AcrR family transcriptional regulator [Legionellales bacterium]
MTKITLTILSDEVLDNTMRLFWRKGFAETSIKEITMLTGFNRSAIYKYFGGKDALFLAMLQRYREYVTSLFIAPLQRNNNDVSGILDFFNQFLPLCQSHSAPNGCFLIATASDLPVHTQPVINFITDFLSLLRQLFYDNLSTAKMNKQLSSELDCSAIADFLVGNVFGLWTLLRANAPQSLLVNHVNGVLSYLLSCK